MTVIVLIAALKDSASRRSGSPLASSSASPSARVRDRLWALLADRIRDGQAVMVEPARNEQRWTIRTAGNDRWYPVDLDGLILAARPRR